MIIIALFELQSAYLMFFKVRAVVCVPSKAACIHLSKFRYLDNATPLADRREIKDVS